MNAASRAALRKRKMQLKARTASPVSLSSTDEARAATRERLAQLLDDRSDLAAAIEDALFSSSQTTVSPKYRSRFRQIYVALRNNSTDFKKRLCSGELSPGDFAVKPLDELKPLDLKQSEKEIHDQNIKQSVTQKLLPENIDQIKDGRDREKWGVSRSAAAID